jgi:hypothetical protein
VDPDELILHDTWDMARHNKSKEPIVLKKLDEFATRYVKVRMQAIVYSMNGSAACMHPYARADSICCAPGPRDILIAQP